MKRRSIILALLMLLPLCAVSASTTGVACAEMADEVQFQDKAVEAELRRTLEIFDRPLTYDDLLAVDYFRYDPYSIWADKAWGSSTRKGTEASGMEVPAIRTLEDLVHCKNLTHIALYHQPVTDISPLQELACLENVYFSDCPGITDLSPLGRLENLCVAGFIGIGAGDYSPVLASPKLFNFYCEDAVGNLDLSALSQTISLQFFFHRGELPAVDYAPLTNHPALGEMSVVGVDDSELQTLLACWPALRSLEIHSAPITNHALENLSGPLSFLTLVNCPGITDLSALERLNLTWLKLAGCSVTDLSPLQGMEALYSFEMTEELPHYTLEDIRAMLPQAQVTYGSEDETQETKPEGMLVFSGERMPLHVAAKDDGGFLLSGIAGIPQEGSIGGHFLNFLELDEEALTNMCPLYGYVAAYDKNGHEQWVYMLPEGAPYQKIVSQPIEDGQVFCTVIRYVHDDEYGMWNGITDAFILDREGQYVKGLPWLVDDGLDPQYGWTLTIPGGLLALEPVDPEDLASYEQVLTMYSFDGQMQWQTSPEPLKKYFIRQLEAFEDGYIGLAVNISAFGEPSDSFASYLIQLDKTGNLQWMEKVHEGFLIDTFALAQDGRIMASFTKYGHSEEGYLNEMAANLLICGLDGRVEHQFDYDAYQVTSIYDILQARDGSMYLWGERSFLAAEGGGFGGGYNIVMRVNGEGEPMGYMRLPAGAGNRQYMRSAMIEGEAGVYIVGSLTEKDGKDRWYIIPLRLDLFTEEW